MCTDFLNSIPSSYLLSALLIIYYPTRFLSGHGCTRILNQVSIFINNVWNYPYAPHSHGTHNSQRLFSKIMLLFFHIDHNLEVSIIHNLPQLMQTIIWRQLRTLPFAFIHTQINKIHTFVQHQSFLLQFTFIFLHAMNWP